MTNLKRNAQTAHTVVKDVMRCAPTHVNSCTHGHPGHVLGALQSRIVAATPSKWCDGVVRHVTNDGWIAIDTLDATETDAATVWVWHHADLTETVSTGDPVALHSLYNALAIGQKRVSVLVSSV